ncbi:hypothetical protein HDU92_000667 [Lobulomyces angularis]|nr:hypothetical protein HDU92_000667 [Lobulomyces angularis]
MDQKKNIYKPFLHKKEEENVLCGTVSQKLNWKLNLLFLNKKFDECLRFIESETIKNATLTHNQYFLKVKGEVFFVKNNFESALKEFEKALMLNKNSVEIIKRLVDCNLALERYEVSIPLLYEGLNCFGEDNQIYEKLGECYIKIGDYTAGVKYLEKSIQVYKDPKLFIKLSNCYLLKRKVDLAMRSIENGLNYFPFDSDLLHLLANQFLSENNKPQAYNYFTKVLERHPDNHNAILAIGSILNERGDHNEALSKYDNSKLLNSDCPYLLNNIGVSFYGKKKFLNAKFYLLKASMLSPFAWIIHHNLGIVYASLKQYFNATQSFGYAFKIQEDFGLLDSGETLLYLAISLDKVGDYETAKLTFEKALEYDSFHPLSILNYAIFLANNTCYKESFERFDYFKTLNERKCETELEKEIGVDGIEKTAELLRILNLNIKLS